MRNYLDEQLEVLKKEMIGMNGLCKQALEMAARALFEGDTTLAKEVRPISIGMDAKEKDIENLCLKLLLRQQPVARDLRQISAALKMITDIERIGDQAEDIADIILQMKGFTPDSSFPLKEMADAVIKMVKEGIEAYVHGNTELAQRVIDEDDIVDQYFYDIKQILINKIVEKHGEIEDTPDSHFILDLLMISKYFERIGDHATNIAEWVIFSVTGIHKESES